MRRAASRQEPPSCSESPHAFPRTPHLRYPALEALLFLFILNVALQTPDEPDFGWHLRTGLDLLAHAWQMPLTDPYSHTMYDWPWVEHAWLTDGLLALMYQGLGEAGLLGVILFFAAVTVAAFLLASATARAERSARLVAVAAALWVARPFLGVRTQLVTLLGMTVVLWIWQRSRDRSASWLWALPPVFLFWANLHGGFTAGLFLLTVMLIGSIAIRLAASRWPEMSGRLDESVPDWPLIGGLALAIGASALATLLNPYGWRLHREIVESLSDTFMLQTLHEWQPLSFDTTAGRLSAGYLVVLGAAMAMGYRRTEPVRWIILFVFLLLSVRHWRNIPFFLIVSVPLLAESVAAGAARVGTWWPAAIRHSKAWGLALTTALACLMIVLGPAHLTQVVRAGLAPESYFRETSYPIEAVRWIEANRDKVGTRMFNEYGHGGFLLWWLPGERVFIDGRMPAWRIGDRRILEDYLALTNWDPPALGVLDKYLVDWALVTTDSPLARALAGARGWAEAYSDTKVTIYVRRRQ